MMTPVAATPASPATPSNLHSFTDGTPSHDRPFMTDTRLALGGARAPTPPGYLWLFRGRSAADHAIRVLTNAPVNHVGMAVVLDDMPPLTCHANIGKGLLGAR